MIFIETSLFTKLLPNYFSDDGYRGLQWYLLEHPEAGDIIRGSGGVRKIRWSQEARGKEVEQESFTIGKSRPMKFGCSRYTLKVKEHPYLAMS